MVNKLAVVAIVAIVATPILLGFGMNIQSTAYTEYAADGESVIVSQLLQNGTTNSYVPADIYRLNTVFANIAAINGGTLQLEYTPIAPIYESTSSNYSSLRATHTQPTTAPASLALSDYNYFYNQFDYVHSAGTYIDAIINHDVNGVSTQLNLSHIHSAYYDYSKETMYYSTYQGGNGQLTDGEVTKCTSIEYYQTGSDSDFSINFWLNKADGTDDQYVDLSAGFHFEGVGYNQYKIIMPLETKEAMLTIDLDSVTDSDLVFSISVPVIGDYQFTKSTVNGEVSWSVRQYVSGGYGPSQNIYYDSSISHNTYQLKITIQKLKSTVENGLHYTYYNNKATLSYVGEWPQLIGQANSYKTYNLDTYDNRYNTDGMPERENLSVSIIQVAYPTSGTVPAKSPTLRMDYALYHAYDVPAIVDNTYDPAQFKTNPSTVIKNPTSYGDSIEFAGVNYVVGSDGNITLGTHKVSVNGLKLESVPVTGGYENKINGNTISTSIQPSTITFYGTWNATISTDSMSAITKDTTEWIPGQFAWDGIDTNFLLVGLFASMAAFIGLAIYGRSHRQSVLPLMLVCGGAALLFFIMI